MHKKIADRAHSLSHLDVVFRYMIADEREGPLVSMDLKDFILTVGSRSPSPGGGSVAALAASLVRRDGSLIPCAFPLVWHLCQSFGPFSCFFCNISFPQITKNGLLPRLRWFHTLWGNSSTSHHINTDL